MTEQEKIIEALINQALDGIQFLTGGDRLKAQEQVKAVIERACSQPSFIQPIPSSTDDKERGAYQKFFVTVARVDDSSRPGGKHQFCYFYVLDLEHDPFAIPALRAYIDACRSEYPSLASDLEKLIEAYQVPLDSLRKN